LAMTIGDYNRGTDLRQRKRGLFSQDFCNCKQADDKVVYKIQGDIGQ
jgi:hypothetical protein